MTVEFRRNRWVALRVRSGEEASVQREFRELLSTETYLPKITVWRRLPRHLAKREGKSRTRVEYPLFPGYLFCVEGITEYSHEDLKRCHQGFLGIVRSEGAALYATEAQIQDIRDREANGSFDNAGSDAALDLGTAVGGVFRVVGGAFRGMAGTAKDSRGDSLLVDLEGKKDVWVPYGNLQSEEGRPGT